MDSNICFESINSVSELLSIISNIKAIYGKKTEFGGCPPRVNGELNDQADFWFRGERNIEYKLCPKVMRKGQFTVEWYDEPLSRFTKEASAYLNNIDLKDTLLCMEYAQHYGTPTRLLDFSTNPLVALWFACSDYNVDGHIWIINEHNYSNVCCCAFMKKFGMDCVDNNILKDYNLNNQDNQVYPVAIYPSYVDARMLVQSSRFLLWPDDWQDLDDRIKKDNWMTIKEPEPKIKSYRFAYKVIIPKNKKETLLKELDMVGVNDKMLFPGLDGIGRYSDYLFRKNT